MIGGTSLMGGEGSLGGTLVGALIMGVLRNGLNLLGVSSFLQQIVIGGVIVGAVLVDTVLKTSTEPEPMRNTHRCCSSLALAARVARRAIARRRRPASTTKTVALVLKTLNHPFFVDMRRGAQEAADRLGVTLQVQAAEREIDVEKQMQIVENLIQTGIEALAITPSGSREIVSALVKATDANVPIVIVDTRVDAKAAADAGVHTRDVHRLRQLRGRQARRRIRGEGHRRQGARRHPRRHSRPRDRRFAAARLPRRGRQDAPGITIVASQPANWERDQGFNVFQNMLQAHPDIDTVFAAAT